MIADRIWSLHAKYPVYSYEKRRLMNMLLTGTDGLSQWQKETVIPETLDMRYDHGWMKEDVQQIVDLLNVREVAAPVLGINKLGRSHDGLGYVGVGQNESMKQGMMQARRKSWFSFLRRKNRDEDTSIAYAESDDQIVGGPMNGMLIVTLIIIVLLGMFVGGVWLIYISLQGTQPSTDVTQPVPIKESVVPGMTTQPVAGSAVPPGVEPEHPLWTGKIPNGTGAISLSGALVSSVGKLAIGGSGSSLSSSGSTNNQSGASIHLRSSSSLSSSVSRMGVATSSSAKTVSSSSVMRSSASQSLALSSSASVSSRAASAATSAARISSSPSSGSSSMQSSRTASMPFVSSASVASASQASASIKAFPLRKIDREVATNRFSDIGATNAVTQPANKLAQLDIFTGYGDMTFKPDNTINRAEIIKIIVLARFQSLPTVTQTFSFSDVHADSWYEKFVQIAAEFGIIRTQSGTAFQPGKPVTTAEFLKMIGVAFSLPTDYPSSYSDVPVDSWYVPYAGIADRYNLFPGRPTGTLQPDRLMTRAGVAIVIHNLLLTLAKQ